MGGTIRRKIVLAGALLTFALGACGCDDDPSETATRPPATGPATATATATADDGAAPLETAALDAVAALGHSNVTGTMSDPQMPWRDAHENSWATGDSPEVQSLYRRLLADHPALEGHNYNYAVNGATVGDLEGQYENLMSEVEVAPDLFLLQFVDNDMRCDGTDTENALAFGRSLDAGLTRIKTDLPEAQFYLTGPWASAQLWTRWAAAHPGHVQGNSGDGPCDVFDRRGRPRVAGVRSLQRIVDAYREQMELVCERHPGCYTDAGALETFAPTDRDLSADLNHLSIAGQRKYADIAWSAMPDEIKGRN